MSSNRRFTHSHRSKYVLDDISNSLLYTASTEYVYDVLGKVKYFFKKTEGEHTRTIFAKHPELNKFRSNLVSTSKYNILSFFPKFIFEQMMKLSNVLFLVISIFQLFPNVSPSGKYTTLIPLSCMLALSAIRELVEDSKRRISDRKTNNSISRVYRNNQWQQVMWHQIRVGDIVRILDGETFPADIVVLSTSDPNSIFYVETCSLDGETNQKIKQALQETKCLTNDDNLQTYELRVDCESPNNRIYEFNGSLSLERACGYIENVSISNTNVGLRGSQLRNTLFTIGAVVYTGLETKIMMNSSASPIKRSSIEKKLNSFIIFLIAILTLFSGISAIYYEYGVIPFVRSGKEHFKIESIENRKFNIGPSFLTFLILFNTLIPISLNVTVETMKIILAYFIDNDLGLYHEESDAPAVTKTSSVIEDLGQVNYVFTDKTGTLTCNLMEMKQFSVHGIIYGQSSDFAHEVRNAPESELQYLNEFFTCLALCNTIISERSDDRYHFKSSSPDEMALAEGILKCGFIIGDRTPYELTITCNNKNVTYELLDVLQFTSDRKRMSVIIRQSGSIKILCKGADSVILSRLDSSTNDDDVLQKINSDLATFANSGYRTLCIASTTISISDYKNWKKYYDEACLRTINREIEVRKCCELVEKDLRLLGATAIEDRLQHGVPHCIKNLREADISFFMLTGDRLETAINIGFATEIISSSMDLRVIEATNLEKCKEELQKIMTDHRIPIPQNSNGDPDDGTTKIKKKVRPEILKDLCLILDGTVFTFATTTVCMGLLVELLINSQSVICCRLSPAQKRDVVKIIRDYVKDATTLAIGDGANDCSMIQASHIGIGITGREGMQAANCSDIAVAQFSYLSRLILYHGHNNYRRIASTIFFCFYKNTVIFMIIVGFNFHCMQSGRVVFEEITYSIYNVCLTSFLPFCFGLFQQVTKPEILLQVPALLKTIQYNRCFNIREFFKWSLCGTFHGIVIYVFVYFSYCKSIVGFNPLPVSLVHFGHVLFWCLISVVSGKATLELHFWVQPSFFCLLIGPVIWIAFVSISSTPGYFKFFQTGGVDLDMWMYGYIIFWLTVFGISFVALLPDIILHTVKNTWLKTPDMVVNELVHRQDLDLSQSVHLRHVADQMAIERELVNKRKHKYLGFAYSFCEDRIFNNLPKFFPKAIIQAPFFGGS